ARLRRVGPRGRSVAGVDDRAGAVVRGAPRRGRSDLRQSTPGPLVDADHRGGATLGELADDEEVSVGVGSAERSVRVGTDAVLREPEAEVRVTARGVAVGAEVDDEVSVRIGVAGRVGVLEIVLVRSGPGRPLPGRDVVVVLGVAAGEDV